MNVNFGLEKFGFSEGDLDMDNLFETEKEKEEKKESVPKVKKEPVVTQTEADFLYDKKISCKVCDMDFDIKVVKYSKTKRDGADRDLRPIYSYVDPQKYDVISCPYCGYTAMTRYYDSLTPAQVRLIRMNVCSKFVPTSPEPPEIITYDMAMDRYKLSLINTIAKKGKISEKAYTCLKMSWLCRGKADILLDEGMTEQSQGVIECRKEERYYYEQAFDGLIKAMEKETYPICGMDSYTLEILIAEMAYKLERYDIASKLVSGLLTSTANRSIKDKALDLKNDIISVLKLL
ncbi:MAG: DUF2225 domain-containing protein [Agathobacter sp.]|nr:DUF2225 domain-containing protein [Agathobacter sp.]